MSKFNRSLRGAVVVTAFWLLSGAASAADPAQADRVLIKDFMFSPMALTTKVGVPVTWVNQDDEPHTVVSDSGAFKSGGLDTNESFSYKFDKPGTYHFTCSIHPRMVGTVVVQ